MENYQQDNLYSPPSGPGGSGAAGSFFNKMKSGLSSRSGGINIPANLKGDFLRWATILSGAVLAILLLLWAGMIFYKKSLTGQIAGLKEDRAAIFSESDRKMAEEIINFDKTAAAAQKILKDHIYSSAAFDALAAATLPQVQWRSFNLTIDRNSINAEGFAADYSVLAKQILALEESGFTGAQISGIALDKEGGVNFSTDFSFDQKILKQ